MQRLLRERDIRARREYTISLGLFAGRPDIAQRPDKPPLRSWETHLPPVLALVGQGWRGVTVTIGPRTGSYLVSLPGTADPQTVDRERPEKVVELIMAAGPQTAT
ncbi:hypothetical protein [Streptosporangium carneum]|uniref:hypothetical protein n=1 Tax=Streptosporangium carneum TaxID=47481 RepID=UPI0022F2E314|nr:hypothetical protein [Streptosporangium carneum]